ncbi:PAS domain-containing protein [Aliagarivorans taiwanensis]|uniref:PAS domain-containing protein n=1 Tax=Aliagarivorans taiwanensis TaxID=561966 RepID=UPI0012F9AB29|nr:PAS domain S-box protein [Aliagarivorans taiwanensis]
MITDVSQKMCDASGYSKQELIGKTHRVLAHPKASRRNHKQLWQTITEGETWNGELYNRTKDGRDYWIKSVISPDLDQDGQLIGYTQVAQDISSKKALEKLSVTDTQPGSTTAAS